MAIELPKFDDKSGLILTVCGKVKSSVTKNREKEPKTVPVSRYKAPSGMVFIRAWISGKKETYLHVDCAVPRFFPDGKTPKVTCKKVDVLNTIARLSDLEIDSKVEASFVIPFSDLPEKGPIRSLYMEQKSADISMRLTGAEISYTGAPIQWIRWSIRKEKDTYSAYVRLRGERITVISDRYLLESWDWIKEQLSIFVLGGKKDA